MFQKLVRRQTNVFDDLAQQGWRNISSNVKWHGRDASIRVTELFVRTTLARLEEANAL